MYYALVLPKIQANLAGAADALMLDCDGFVSETNATNVFMVKGSTVSTPLADYCLPGKYVCMYVCMYVCAGVNGACPNVTSIPSYKSIII